MVYLRAAAISSAGLLVAGMLGCDDEPSETSGIPGDQTAQRASANAPDDQPATPERAEVGPGASAPRDPEHIEPSEPPGPTREFVQVAVGEFFVCGLTDEGKVLCRGDNRLGQVTPPNGDPCWFGDGDAIRCYDANGDGEAAPPPATYRQVEAGDAHACAIRDDGRVDCWGTNRFEQLDVPEGTFEEISAGWRHNCGIRPDGTVECWGFGSQPGRGEGDRHDDYNQAIAPDGEFEAVTAGGVHSCGIRPDGRIECWGAEMNGMTDPPDTKLTSITARRWHTCGLAADGEAVCWGLGSDPDRHEGQYNFDHDQAVPPDGTFQKIAAGYYFTCGIRRDGSPECWGIGPPDSDEPSPYNGQTDPPARALTDLDADNSLACGIEAEGGDIVCWGSVPLGMSRTLGRIEEPE